VICYAVDNLPHSIPCTEIIKFPNTEENYGALAFSVTVIRSFSFRIVERHSLVFFICCIDILSVVVNLTHAALIPNCIVVV